MPDTRWGFPTYDVESNNTKMYCFYSPHKRLNIGIGYGIRNKGYRTTTFLEMEYTGIGFGPGTPLLHRFDINYKCRSYSFETRYNFWAKQRLNIGIGTNITRDRSKVYTAQKVVLYQKNKRLPLIYGDGDVRTWDAIISLYTQYCIVQNRLAIGANLFYSSTIKGEDRDFINDDDYYQVYGVSFTLSYTLPFKCRRSE